MFQEEKWWTSLKIFKFLIPSDLLSSSEAERNAEKPKIKIKKRRNPHSYLKPWGKTWRTTKQELFRKIWRYSVLAVHRWRLLFICLFWTCCLLKAKACQILGKFFFKSFCCFSKQVMSPTHPLHKQTFLQIIRGMEFIWQRRQFCRDGSLRAWGFYFVCPNLCPLLLNFLLMHPV